jgi:hypothetical protein
MQKGEFETTDSLFEAKLTGKNLIPSLRHA